MVSQLATLNLMPREILERLPRKLGLTEGRIRITLNFSGVGETTELIEAKVTRFRIGPSQMHTFRRAVLGPDDRAELELMARRLDVDEGVGLRETVVEYENGHLRWLDVTWAGVILMLAWLLDVFF